MRREWVNGTLAPEVRERAVRIVEERGEEHPSPWAAMRSVAEKLGCRTRTLGLSVRQAVRYPGRRPGLTTCPSTRTPDSHARRRRQAPARSAGSLIAHSLAVDLLCVSRRFRIPDPALVDCQEHIHSRFVMRDPQGGNVHDAERIQGNAPKPNKHRAPIVSVPLAPQL